MMVQVTELSKAYQRLEEKALTIYKLSGLSLDNIIEMLAKGYELKPSNTPTADVVEVVRCKDCVNYCGFERCKNGICDVDVVNKRAVYPNDYCSYGERRTSNE